MKILQLPATTLALLFAAPLMAQDLADVILVGGHVVTVDDDKPEAQAIAILGDRILAVGSDEEIRAYQGDKTQVIDLQGRLATPGFIDGHAHLLGLGQTKTMLDLTRASTWEETVGIVETAVQSAKPGEWILGRGWHQEKWTSVPDPHVDGYPTHTALSAASPNNPVILTHVSGHMCFANAAAMKAAFITAETEAPKGGEIMRSSNGEAIGVFRENATGLIWEAEAMSRADQTLEEYLTNARHAVRLAARECLSKGITSFQDAGSSFLTIDLLRQMAEQGEIGMRLWVMVRDDPTMLSEHLAETKVTGHADNFFSVGGIKLMMDGALGAHGAWLLEPYSDLPESKGLSTSSVVTANRYARLAVKHDYQLCVHAIGDRANREILDVFEKAFKKYPRETSRRWRVEHAQHVSPRDIPRFAELGVIASMQGNHCTSDGGFVIERLGEERSREGAYVWQTLLQSGAVVTSGTDAPVEDIDPIANFHSLVTRQLANGDTFFPGQKLTRAQALKSYTLSCAYSVFEEELKGSLTPGKLADIVILSKDIMTCPADEIPSAQIDYTIVGGEIAYQSKGAPVEASSK